MGFEFGGRPHHFHDMYYVALFFVKLLGSQYKIREEV
jgi:hypothetical protein